MSCHKQPQEGLGSGHAKVPVAKPFTPVPIMFLGVWVFDPANLFGVTLRTVEFGVKLLCADVVVS